MSLVICDLEPVSSVLQTLVWMLKDRVSPSISSASEKIQRGLNRGQQDFDANTDSWPIGQAIPKLESNIQISGSSIHYFLVLKLFVSIMSRLINFSLIIV